MPRGMRSPFRTFRSTISLPLCSIAVPFIPENVSADNWSGALTMQARRAPASRWSLRWGALLTSRRRDGTTLSRSQAGRLHRRCFRDVIHRIRQRNSLSSLQSATLQDRRDGKVLRWLDKRRAIPRGTRTWFESIEEQGRYMKPGGEDIIIAVIVVYVKRNA